MNKFLALLKNKTIAILAVVLIANIVVIGYLGYQTYVAEKPIPAIDFKTLTEGEVKEWYTKSFEENDNLTIKYEYDETIEEGKIIRQSVNAGEAINPEEGITIVISNGRDPNKEIKLPNFVEEAYTKEKIEKFFEDNYFTDVNFEYEVSELPKDQVIRVNVSGKAKRNQLILITLSAGENEEEIEIEVPDFKKYSVANARAWGQSNSVTIRINYVFSDDFAEGSIISQSVKAGETVNLGSRIILQVSQGKGIKIADLTGDTKDVAIKWLTDRGLKHKLIFGYNDKVEKGKVISIEPKAGSIVAEGEVVHLHISNGKDPDLIEIAVESKVGKSEDEFKSYIKNLGLTARKDGSSYSESVGKGLIIKNDIGNFKKNQSVGYTVSLGAYTLNAADFEGKSLNEGNMIISRENALNAGIKLNTNGVYSDDVAKDTLFGCKADGKTMTCNISKGAMATVGNFIGSNKTGSFLYQNVNYEVIFDDFYTDGSTYGEVYEQSIASGTRVEPGSSVVLKVRLGAEEKAYIEKNYTFYNGSSVEETVSKLESNLGGFNLSISYAKDPNLSIGAIISFKVNGGPISNSGMYPLSTRIEVVICDGRPEN